MCARYHFSGLYQFYQHFLSFLFKFLSRNVLQLFLPHLAVEGVVSVLDGRGRAVAASAAA
jgi:hypothetical protein